MPKITKLIIENTPAPAKGDTWIWDTELPGFGARISAGGRKVYVVRYRTRDGKRVQRKMTLCRYADAPPDKARSLARDVFMKVATGADPAATRRKENDPNLTVEAMFKARIAYMRANGRTHADEVERILLLAKNNAADFFGRTTPPDDVTVTHVTNFVATFFKAGHRGAADKARSYLHATFRWAILAANDYTIAQRQDWELKANPVALVARDHGATVARERNLDAEEIRRVWDACEHGTTFSESVAVCLRLIVGCGQRIRETLRMCGSEIDLDKAEWKMPIGKTKTRQRAHIVPLSRHVIEDLRCLKEKHGDGPLFPPRPSDDGHLGTLAVSMQVHKWLADGSGSDLANFQPRDLRRTWKSRAGDGAGIDRFTRDLIQQHAKSDTGSIHYDLADYMPQMREAMVKWDAYLDIVLGKFDPTNVIKLPLAA